MGINGGAANPTIGKEGRKEPPPPSPFPPTQHLSSNSPALPRGAPANLDRHWSVIHLRPPAAVNSSRSFLLGESLLFASASRSEVSRSVAWRRLVAVRSALLRSACLVPAEAFREVFGGLGRRRRLLRAFFGYF